MLIVVHDSLFWYCMYVCVFVCVCTRVLVHVFKRFETEWSHMTAGHTQSAVARIQHLKHRGGVVPGCSIF